MYSHKLSVHPLKCQPCSNFPSVHQSGMITTLAAPCTPCALVYITVFDSEDSSDDAPSHLSDWYILSCKKGQPACPWIKALARTI